MSNPKAPLKVVVVKSDKSRESSTPVSAATPAPLAQPGKGIFKNMAKNRSVSSTKPLETPQLSSPQIGASFLEYNSAVAKIIIIDAKKLNSLQKAVNENGE